MNTEFVILSSKQNMVNVYDKATGQTIQYSKNFLKKRFEMGLFDITNPELLYNIPVKFVNN